MIHYLDLYLSQALLTYLNWTHFNVPNNILRILYTSLNQVNTK